MISFRTKLLIFPIIVFSAFSFQASASIELEPYIGYYTAKSSKSINVTTTSPATTTATSTNDSFSGTAYGGKLGWSILLLTIGGDFMVLNHGSENSTNIGPYVAVGIGPIAAKVTYFASSTNKTPTSTVTGNGFKAGLGVSVAPFVMINADYLNLKYTKITDNELGSSVTFNSYDEKVSGAMLSVSLVF